MNPSLSVIFVDAAGKTKVAEFGAPFVRDQWRRAFWRELARKDGQAPGQPLVPKGGLGVVNAAVVNAT
jgi:hypothetical protein